MSDVQPTRTGRVPLGEQEIHWEEHSSPAADGSRRQAVCLLNGLAMHTQAWYGFLDRLLDAYDVLLWDYPGQGQSTKHDLPVTFPELADGMAAVLDAAGRERVHLMGISYGGFVALETARLHADRLDTLVLSGILLFEEQLFEMYEALSLRFYRSDEREFETYTHYLYEKIFGEAFLRRIGRDALEPMRQRFYQRYVEHRHSLIRLTEAQDPFFASVPEHLEAFQGVATPTLVLAGQHDRCIPPWVQRKIADVLPNSRYEELADCGHVVYIEAPDAFFERVKELARSRRV